MPLMPPRDRQAAAREAAREAARATPAVPRSKRGADPITGELRRRDVLPLLVLHYISEGPAYGNQLMERIADLTAGVLNVNPNTMYPLLRELEANGLIKGEWEHPEKRSRRYYSLTKAGRDVYEQLHEETLPFLGALARSLERIFSELYD
jgi:PadR family transcriptional regulator PadR